MKTKSKLSASSELSSGSAGSATATAPAASRPASPSSSLVSIRTGPRTFTHEEISSRARAIWEREGRPEGRDKEHWMQAELELRDNVKVTNERRFADPDRLMDPSGEPADDVDRRLDEIASPPAERSQTSL